VGKRFLPERGRVSSKALPQGPGGRALCRRCQIEVPKGRRTFCSDACVHEWKLRSQPNYLREHVFQRDRGRCSACGLDTEDLARRLRQMPKSQASRVLERLGMADCLDRSFWEAHHVKAVMEGGGSCGLENLRTLCVSCHRRWSLKQRALLQRQSMNSPTVIP
jgi:5-methylcytosine-specific restriction protein A